MQSRSPSCSKRNGPGISAGAAPFQITICAQERGEGTGSAVFLSGARLLGGASFFAGSFGTGAGEGARRCFGTSTGACFRGTSGGASRVGGIGSEVILAFGCLGGASRVGGIGSEVILGLGGDFSISGALR
jgi:hypothetical protein